MHIKKSDLTTPASPKLVDLKNTLVEEMRKQGDLQNSGAPSEEIQEQKEIAQRAFDDFLEEFKK